ncbi:adenosylcobinamide-phosphate synthase CbiB [Teredinibacter sp. KSP-S5-2]|uniref:adenosylcobinamide-phosphate synthase CbiB n=1 Tax=Teredinibacter sp. KSP-S5-2 TaxID=3034506 RepID=UPI0029350B3C|nr:adenosylcobinamide-phosphate synthase CbiB [Teredinibacter sp. KSP-S5-2]WNO08368.1 adenosylcobinamide-phosphate synthase CbiB [Teredinibacter sp. KSP-S5-2]
MFVLSLLLGVLFDWLLGEPKKFHPLVGFGHWVKRVERFFVKKLPDSSTKHILLGGMAWAMLVIPPVTLVSCLVWYMPQQQWLLDAVVVYFGIAYRSLADHVKPIYSQLCRGNLAKARDLVARIVSRDMDNADEQGVRNAAIESCLENGSDAIFAPIFWFLCLGAPGVVLYRLANTLDAMWGYKHGHYLYFGRVAARIDDVLNYVPARLTAMSYALLGSTYNALRCWRTQTKRCASPNAGPVMCSGAGALNVILGGRVCYHGKEYDKPVMGAGRQAEDNDILRALSLVWHTLILWLFSAALIGWTYVF